nr:MAG TPA: hypothetical protein [Caudoviricetes sp.]
MCQYPKVKLFPAVCYKIVIIYSVVFLDFLVVLE